MRRTFSSANLTKSPFDVLYADAEAGDEFCEGYDYGSSALGHGGSLVWVNSVESSAGSFSTVLSYVVGALILSVFALNFMVETIPFLSHQRKHVNSVAYTLLAGGLGGISYTMLAGERHLTLESAISISPVVLVMVCLVWYKESIDVLVYKVCEHNDGDHDKVLLELEIRFDKSGWSFADWLGVKNNGGEEDLEKWWAEFNENGCDRLDLVRDMTQDELQENVGLNGDDAEKLRKHFKRLEKPHNFKKASMLKDRYSVQLTKCRAVFTSFAGQLWQGKAPMLLRLMIQYAAAVQYYKSLKVHLVSFVLDLPKWTSLGCQRWKGKKVVKRFGEMAKRKLQAWFRIMKDHPGRLVDLAPLFRRALKDMEKQSLMTGNVRKQKEYQLGWVRTYHTKLLAAMLKANMTLGETEVRNIDVHEEESKAFMRAHLSMNWPRWDRESDAPPDFDADNDDDSEEETEQEPTIWYQRHDQTTKKKVASGETSLQEFEQLLTKTDSPITDETKVFSQHSDFKAIFDGSWTAWGECQFLFAPWITVDEDKETFKNPLPDMMVKPSVFEVEEGGTAKAARQADQVVATAPKRIKMEIIEREELMKFETFRQFLMRDNHVTGCQAFLVDSGYDETTKLEVRVIGMQTYGTLEVVSEFASDATDDLDFATSLLGSFMHAVKSGNLNEMCTVVLRALNDLIHHVWVWVTAPCHQAERNELRVFFAPSADQTKVEGPVTVTNMRLRYLAGSVDESTLVWTSEQYGWKKMNETTGKVEKWKKWRKIVDVTEIMTVVGRQPMLVLIDQAVKKTHEKNSHRITKLKKGARVYVVGTNADESGVTRYEIELKRGKTGWVKAHLKDGTELLHVEDEATRRAAMLAEVNEARRNELEALKLGDLMKLAEEEFQDNIESKEHLYKYANGENPKNDIIGMLMHDYHDKHAKVEQAAHVARGKKGAIPLAESRKPAKPAEPKTPKQG